MTDTTQGSSQGLDNSAAINTQAVSNPVASEPVHYAQNTQNAPESSKSFTQAEVGRIAADAKREAVETYKRLQVEQPEYWAKKYGEPLSQANQSQGMVPNASSQAHSLTPEQLNTVRRTAAEEIQRQMEEARTEEQRKARLEEDQRIVTEFFTKLNTGKEKYPDFDKKLQTLDLSRMANTVYLSRNLDNQAVADVFAHLADNPTKAMTIEQMTYFNPSLANNELQKLANSLKEIDEANKMKLPQAPLSQTKPGNSGLGSGQWTTAAAKQKYRG